MVVASQNTRPNVEMAVTKVPDPAHVFYIVSTICDAIFLLILPVRLWKLRGSAIKNALSWQGPFKAVSIPRSNPDFQFYV